MKKYKLFMLAVLIQTAVLSSCNGNTDVAIDDTDNPIKRSDVSMWKEINEANPISSNVFCADPTAVEYEGRLYVYGTNDHQQYFNAEKNTYEKIKSLVCFSTDDMVNWTYHGEINVGKIVPWIWASWAPSICSRVEVDGLTHFYLYFSNSGAGTGVITSTSPTGPWSDPLGHALVSTNTKGLKDCPNPFDPGVCIDENGVGWLSFGSGKAPNGTAASPGSARIVQLGDDMISFASDFVKIDAPYLFEASELNYVNGTYIYTFNNSWDKREDWPIEGVVPSSACSMSYMTTKTPLDSSSWEYKGHYFKNPGEMGLNYSNNHTHFEKFKGQWYLFYHTLTLQEKAKIEGGFRSMCVDVLNFDEDKIVLSDTPGTRKGVSAIKNLNPFEKNAGTTIYTSADLWYDNLEKPEEIASKAIKDGAWLMVKNVDFSSDENALSILSEVKGNGKIKVCLDKVDSSSVAEIEVNHDAYTEVTAALQEKVKGVHDIYFVFSAEGICLRNWKFY